MKITVSEYITGLPENIFTWIEDPLKARKWQKSVKGGSITKLESNKIGTTFTEVIEENGKSLKMSGTITKYEKNKIIGFHIESQVHSFNVSYSLNKEGGFTKLKIDADIKWKFPMNLISFFMGKKIAAKLVKDLENEIQELKRLIEKK